MPPSPIKQQKSGQEWKVPAKPGNVYGNKHPVEIEQSTRHMKDWKKVVGDFSVAPRCGRSSGAIMVPGPSSQPLPERESSAEEEMEEASESEDEVEQSIEPSGFTTPEEDTDVLLARLCWEGGVELQNLLISKAVSPTANGKTPKEWKYRDIATLPQAELEEWRTACNKELEALRKRKVYNLVERPRGRKVIKNRWVFNQKPDGCKKACLVAKGFSQVEGMDYNAVFSPVV
jgi:hypothetical protein